MLLDKRLTTTKLTDGTSCFLDIVRGISSQAVLFGHGISYVGILNYLSPPHSPYMQNVAVVVFFFLSGFLITHTVIRKSSNGLYRFDDYFIERFSRIYSAFLPSLVFVLLLDSILIAFKPGAYSYYSALNLKTFFGNIFMLQDFPVYFKGLTSFGSARPFWTLAIEWWLYMAFGWIVLFNSKSLKWKLVKMALIVPLLVVPYHNFTGRGNGLTFVWIWGALSGLILVKVLSYRRLSVKVILSCAVLFTILAISKVLRAKDPYSFKFGTLMSISFFLWIIFLNLKNFKVPSLIRKFSSNLASFSFTLYLVHYTVFDFIVSFFKESLQPELIFFIGFLLSNILSFYLAQITELKHKQFASWLKAKCSSVLIKLEFKAPEKL